jgi:hypothetical protein
MENVKTDLALYLAFDLAEIAEAWAWFRLDVSPLICRIVGRVT